MGDPVIASARSDAQGNVVLQVDGPAPGSVGFTGTRRGMTEAQVRGAAEWLAEREVTELHLGDCVGADAELHALARAHLGRATLVGHPPAEGRFRARLGYDRELEPRTYLERNRELVGASAELLACPAESSEQNLGGTWYTVRVARRHGIPVTILWPDGTRTEERRDAKKPVRSRGARVPDPLGLARHAGRRRLDRVNPLQSAKRVRQMLAAWIVQDHGEVALAAVGEALLASVAGELRLQAQVRQQESDAEIGEGELRADWLADAETRLRSRIRAGRWGPPRSEYALRVALWDARDRSRAEANYAGTLEHAAGLWRAGVDWWRAPGDWLDRAEQTLRASLASGDTPAPATRGELAYRLRSYASAPLTAADLTRVDARAWDLPELLAGGGAAGGGRALTTLILRTEVAPALLEELRGDRRTAAGVTNAWLRMQLKYHADRRGFNPTDVPAEGWDEVVREVRARLEEQAAPGWDLTPEEAETLGDQLVDDLVDEGEVRDALRRWSDRDWVDRLVEEAETDRYRVDGEARALLGRAAAAARWNLQRRWDDGEWEDGDDY